MKKTLTLALIAAACAAHADEGHVIQRNYMVTGAADLQPVDANNADGHVHLAFRPGQFDLKHPATFPAVFSLDDDGRKKPVKFYVSTEKGRLEYLLSGAPSNIFLEQGKREVILVAQPNCSIEGVKIEGNGRITCPK
ncbi:hypothetical protein [Burkholderia vietnamiensis]|uniref:hypothetical protein n=1 Tax=Burkholderia vietnamiensis TaxID=60552 RepID=UPI00159392AB|nr:hypothetical protein [Burkholderia vietnamiensis]